MVYLPVIESAYQHSGYQMGPYLAVLYTECVSLQAVAYAHALLVYEQRAPGYVPVMAVAAEVNAFDERGDCGHFLGIFPGSLGSGVAHSNLGCDEDWADLERFATRALALVADYTGIAQPAQPVALKPQYIRFGEAEN
jgi:hypothetical protein